MLRLAAEDCPGLEVLDWELRREGPSYTVDTLRQLRESYPGDELYLCMGTDMFRSFESWYQPKQICAMARIAMAHRQAPDSEELRALTKAFRNAHSRPAGPAAAGVGRSGGLSGPRRTGADPGQRSVRYGPQPEEPGF